MAFPESLFPTQPPLQLQIGRVKVGCFILATISVVTASVQQAVARADAGEAAGIVQVNPVEEADRGEAERALEAETSTNENPDANRRTQHQFEERTGVEEDKELWGIDLYASVRLHAINSYDIERDTSKNKIGDGASRIGASGSWAFHDGWELFGRLEAGFDVLDTFTTSAQHEEDGNIVPRLYHLGMESDLVYIKAGKSWSTYYTVAGATDRFAIFGGNATGVYNAETDGGATGTGRADDAIQTLFYIDPRGLFDILPFNLNLQYQVSQPIPHVSGQDYEYSWSSSAWLESAANVGVGLAYHRATIENLHAVEIETAGIDGDAIARALAFKTYGARWIASLVFSDLENVETTDQLKYFNGRGVELYATWNVSGRWWLVGGGNWLDPDSGETQAGEYEVDYEILGLHYTFDSFHRMIYAEWRIDHGTLASGRSRESEFTVGVRWDFGY